MEAVHHHPWGHLDVVFYVEQTEKDEIMLENACYNFTTSMSWNSESWSSQGTGVG